MNALHSLSFPLAELGPRPLFGNPWLALLAILGGVALVMIVVASVGRWLAATHPTSAPPSSVAMQTRSGPTPEVLAVIAAAVEVSVGQNARIAEVHPVKPVVPGVEALMQQWSVEGRRQIYSSHQIR